MMKKKNINKVPKFEETELFRDSGIVPLKHSIPHHNEFIIGKAGRGLASKIEVSHLV